MHKLIYLTGKKYREHACEKLEIAPLNDFPFSGFRLRDTIYTRAVQ